MPNIKLILRTLIMQWIGLCLLWLMTPSLLLSQKNTIELRLSAPDGGEVLTPGTEYLIRWSDTASEPKKYRLEYSLNAGNLWNLIEDNIERKEYNWKVPYLLSDSCFVKVTAYSDSSYYLPITSSVESGSHWIEFDRTGMKLVISGGYNTVKVWSGQTGQLLLVVPNSGYVPVARFSPDGNLLATIDSDSLIILYNTTSGKSVVRIVSPNDVYHSLSFLTSANGVFNLVASGRSSTKVFSLLSGEVIDEYPRYDILDAIMDSTLVLLYDRDDGILQVLDEKSRSIKQIQFEGNSEILAACFSHKGKFIATGLQEGTTQIWESATGALRYSTKNTNLVSHVEFSPNDSLLLSVSPYTNMVKILDVNSGELVHEIVEPTPRLRGAHFGSKGDLIITYGGNNGVASAHLWSAPGWEQSHVYWHNYLFMFDALINPDGSNVVTVDDIKALIWPFDISQEIADSSLNSFRIGYLVGVSDYPTILDCKGQLFPNPASNYVILNLDPVEGVDLTRASVHMMNVCGVDVTELIDFWKFDEKSLFVEWETMPKGAYSVVYNNGSKKYMFPLIVE